MTELYIIIAWCGGNLFAFLSLRVFCHWRSDRIKSSFVSILTSVLVVGAIPVANSEVRVQVNPIDALLALDDTSLLEEIQKQTFKYFWDFAHPGSGMIRERNTSGDLVTSGGSGFGMMAILVGIHRGFITYEQGRDRVQQVVTFLANADRFHGVWPHWMNGNSGKVIPFSPRDNGGDLVETAFLMQGLLTARHYFSRDDLADEQLRQEITALWEGVDWNWYRKQVQKELFWHWSPTGGFEINLPLRGWNETMIAYVLAIASPTHQVPADLYHNGWANTNYLNGQTFHGYKLEVGNGTGGPLFFTHYSFLGLNPNNIRDRYANYFFQGQNQTLINQAYCVENKAQHAGYGPDIWGLTASDDPDGYKAHAPNADADNGTITPTAAISSIIYTPEASIRMIRKTLETHREKVWGPMGFYDAFNVGRNWFADSYLAIDQGPIICMIENYRSGLLWDHFMDNEEIKSSLERIGFVSDASTTSVVSESLPIYTVYPNPSAGALMLQWGAKQHGAKSIQLMDLSGHMIQHWSSNGGSEGQELQIRHSVMPGVYVLSVSDNETRWQQKIIITTTTP